VSLGSIKQLSNLRPAYSGSTSEPHESILASAAFQDTSGSGNVAPW
jgi:hypothetical protein